MTLDGFLLLQRRMSVQQLLALFDAHAAKTLSDYELSLRLHRLDGRGVLAADGAGADGGAAAASHATALERRTLSHSPPSEKHEGEAQAAEDPADEDRRCWSSDIQAKAKALSAHVPDVTIIPDSDEEAGAGGICCHATGQRPASTSAARQQAPGCYEMRVTADLDTSFPPPSVDGRFAPSVFQQQLLEHVACVREQAGHCTGLLVMATALGKTVFCILDLERQFRQAQAHDSAHADEAERRGGEQAGHAEAWRGDQSDGGGEEVQDEQAAEGVGGSMRKRECDYGGGLVSKRARGRGGEGGACGGERQATNAERTSETGGQVGTRFASKWRRELGVLEALGFPQKSCALALEKHHGSAPAAAHWLLELQVLRSRVQPLAFGVERAAFRVQRSRFRGALAARAADTMSLTT